MVSCECSGREHLLFLVVVHRSRGAWFPRYRHGTGYLHLVHHVPHPVLVHPERALGCFLFWHFSHLLLENFFPAARVGLWAGISRLRALSRSPPFSSIRRLGDSAGTCTGKMVIFNLPLRSKLPSAVAGSSQVVSLDENATRPLLQSWLTRRWLLLLLLSFL